MGDIDERVLMHASQALVLEPPPAPEGEAGDELRFAPRARRLDFSGLHELLEPLGEELVEELSLV